MKDEKIAREHAEVTMNAAKTQLSKIAKEKHELVIELKRKEEVLETMESRAKYAETDRSRLMQEMKVIQVSYSYPSRDDV